MCTLWNCPAAEGEAKSKPWAPGLAVLTVSAARSWLAPSTTLLPLMARARLAEAALPAVAAVPALEFKLSWPPETFRLAPAAWLWAPEMIRVPGPFLVILPDRVSGALISWVPPVVVIALVTVRVPLLPCAIVYLLALSKFRLATERLPSRVTVRGAVILPRKFAIAVGELGGGALPVAGQAPAAVGVDVPLRIRGGGGDHVQDEVGVVDVVPEREGVAGGCGAELEL